MLRNRTYLLGLGAGLIIAALVLQIVYEAEKVASRDTAEVPAQISLELLQEEAHKRGWKLYKQDEALLTEEEVENRIQEALSKQPPQETGRFAFSIGAGSDVSTIAYMLVEMGLIDDWRQFVDEIESRGLANRMQARYYLFTEKPELQQLITELTAAE